MLSSRCLAALALILAISAGAIWPLSSLRSLQQGPACRFGGCWAQVPRPPHKIWASHALLRAPLEAAARCAGSAEVQQHAEQASSGLQHRKLQGEDVISEISAPLQL